MCRHFKQKGYVQYTFLSCLTAFLLCLPARDDKKYQKETIHASLKTLNMDEIFVHSCLKMERLRNNKKCMCFLHKEFLYMCIVQWLTSSYKYCGYFHFDGRSHSQFALVSVTVINLDQVSNHTFKRWHKHEKHLQRNRTLSSKSVSYNGSVELQCRTFLTHKQKTWTS